MDTGFYGDFNTSLILIPSARADGLESSLHVMEGNFPLDGRGFM